MQTRSDARTARFGFSGTPYTWNLREATMRFHILDADGTFVDAHEDVTMFFLLFDFKEEPSD